MTPGAGEAVSPALVAYRLAALRSRVAAAGGDPGRVRVVAVTKGFGAAAGRAALSAGLADLGENYAAELIEKAAALGEGSGAVWHFLGAVQRNKVARLAPFVGCWQGVDRLVEGEAIARHRPGATVLVEVDCSGDPGRGGAAPPEVPELVGALRRLELDVAGLMTVAPAGGGEPARRCFTTVGRLVGELGLAEASMGMSDDLELAVAAGSTMVRVGRALFGPRPGPAQVPQ